CLCIRRVCRGRTLRGGGVLLEPCFDGLQTLQQGHDQRLDTGRRLLPIGGRNLHPCRYSFWDIGCWLHRGSSRGVSRSVAQNVWRVSQKERGPALYLDRRVSLCSVTLGRSGGLHECL